MCKFIIAVSILLISSSILYSEESNNIKVNYVSLLNNIKKTGLIEEKLYKSIWGGENVQQILQENNSLHVKIQYGAGNTDGKQEWSGNRDARLYIHFDPPRNFRQTIIFTAIAVEGDIAIDGHTGSKIHFELHDINEKKMIGPRVMINKSGQKFDLLFRPTLEEPIPTGAASSNFDLSRVEKLCLNFSLGRLSSPRFPVSGKLSLNDIYILNDINSIALKEVSPFFKDVKTVSGRLKESSETRFFLGINYPWNHYGWDLGKSPYGPPENQGWSSCEAKLIKDFQTFSEAGLSMVRMFLFCDFRTGLSYQDGKLVGLDKYVLQDIESLFKAASLTKIKIIPVLLDFYIAGDIYGNDTSKRPEIIFGEHREPFLTNVLPNLLEEIERLDKKYGHPVWALEIMNEPENMTLLTIPGYFTSFKTWCRDVIHLIHTKTSLPVTIGSHSIVDMQKWWKDLDLDIWQFHFYSYMTNEHEFTPLNLSRQRIELPGSMFCGEADPKDMKTIVDKAKKNGYQGVLFWSWTAGDGIEFDMEKLRKIVKWINK